MTAAIVKACRITAMRVGHSRLTSEKFPMSPSAFLLGIVPGPEFPVMEITNRRNALAREHSCDRHHSLTVSRAGRLPSVSVPPIWRPFGAAFFLAQPAFYTLIPSQL